MGYIFLLKNVQIRSGTLHELPTRRDGPRVVIFTPLNYHQLRWGGGEDRAAAFILFFIHTAFIHNTSQLKSHWTDEGSITDIARSGFITTAL